ncbi:hypothetical protein CC2G_000233 [Coprinopsis cinerea AmutBmut pab1-1]|nr:hypothetical protein CC2G_000233 [Coprinopsis cinerea AmutBmut pab1-1]
MVSFVEWVALPSLAAVSSPFRAICQFEAADRVKIGLQPILNAFEIDFADFISALGDENAFVGSTALRVMYIGSTFESTYARLPRLTVVVPRGKADEFIESLKKPSWTWKEQPIGFQSRATIKSVVEAKVSLSYDFQNDSDVEGLVPEPAPGEPDSEFCVASRKTRRERLKRTVYLRVVEGTGHVLQALAGADSTRDMIAITSTRIYLPWPKLFHANLGLTGTLGWDRGHNNRCVPDVQMDNRWNFPCGKSCPILPKKGVAGDGTGVFFWNGVKEREYVRKAKEWEEECGWGGGWHVPDEEEKVSAWLNPEAVELFNKGELLNRDAFKYILRPRCENPHCPSFEKPALRFRRTTRLGG